MRRTLTHFWKINVAVALGAAVATAVLTGALLVGDSVRASLRSLVLDRLGSVDCALVAPRFFRGGLATSLSIDDESGAGAGVAPVILLEGAATHARSRARAPVQILGVDDRFSAFFGDNGGLPAMHRQGPFPSAILNERLAAELGAAAGDAVLLALPRRAEVPRATVFGRRDSEDVVQTLRVVVAAIVPDRGPGGFGLHPHQAAPHNVYLDLGDLQRELGLPGRANALLARYPGVSGTIASAALQRDLQAALGLTDLGLVLRELPGRGLFALESEQFILGDARAGLAAAAASGLGIPRLPVFTYLANSLSAGERSLPYSTVSALGEGAFGGGFGEMLLAGGGRLPPLREGEIALNEWAAADLAVVVGDSLRLEYFVVDEGEQLSERSARLRVAGVLQMRGLAADPGLTPRYPGIQDARDMSAWSPPFPLDLDRIRPRDEAYWDEYGAAPKAFVSEGTGKKLWGSRHGSLTALRLGARPGEPPAAAAAAFERAYLAAVQPQRLGMSFIPVRERSLKAADGATDFGGLFIGFSLFLIAAAAMLMGLLFRLGVEQRVREMGLLRALGMPLRRVRRRFLGEGLAVAALGGLLGTAAAAAYAGMMMAGLRTLWREAVGTAHLSLTVTPATLGIGYAASLIIAAAVVAWTVRSLGRLAPRALLAGETSRPSVRRGKGALLFAAGAALAAGALSAAGSLVSAATASVLFFASGALLLAAGVAGFASWLRTGGGPASGLPPTTLGLAVTSTRRQPGRSLLAAGLVACACFAITAVAANRRAGLPDAAALERDSGTGGYAVRAKADIPVFTDLNEDDGLIEEGFTPEERAMLGGSRIFRLRGSPGEDVSCLNLYKPARPTLLGLPAGFIERGGFRFAEAAPEAGSNPWELLTEELEPGVVPAIGDYNSVRWILHSGLGEEILLADESGGELRLRLVGLLQGSIFQSEILVSEEQFKRHFPGAEGYRYFLVEGGQQEPALTAALLERRMETYGLEATATPSLLARFGAVENTYLSTFQTLGGFGLLLGTVGLALVLLRNAIERSGELAAWRACGFSRARLRSILVLENAFLLLAGAAIGTIAALVAVAPHLAVHLSGIPWGSLAATLAAVLGFGVCAAAAASGFVLRQPLLPALRRE